MITTEDSQTPEDLAREEERQRQDRLLDLLETIATALARPQPAPTVQVEAPTVKLNIPASPAPKVEVQGAKDWTNLEVTVARDNDHWITHLYINKTS